MFRMFMPAVVLLQIVWLLTLHPQGYIIDLSPRQSPTPTSSRPGESRTTRTAVSQTPPAPPPDTPTPTRTAVSQTPPAPPPDTPTPTRTAVSQTPPAPPLDTPTPTRPGVSQTRPAPPTPTPATVVLGSDTRWPVRAGRIIGAGYELVDASTAYDWALQRDVYGTVARAFWGEQLYSQHPHGIRLTLIDPVWDGRCPGPVAPLALDWASACLQEGFGDGAGALIYVGCALPAQQYHDPQECFIAIAADGPYLTDIVVGASITAENMIVAGYAGRWPDMSQGPFQQLGEAYREGDQWRWRNPYLRVVRVDN